MTWRKYLFLNIFNPKLILLALHFRILTYEAAYLEMMDKYQISQRDGENYYQTS